MIKLKFWNWEPKSDEALLSQQRTNRGNPITATEDYSALSEKGTKLTLAELQLLTNETQTQGDEMSKLQVSKLQQAEFYMDALDEMYEGYTLGEYWNGFACPYFTAEVATRILMDTGLEWQYKFDRFIVVCEDGGNWSFGVVYTDDGQKLYAIGAWGWVWNESIG